MDADINQRATELINKLASEPGNQDPTSSWYLIAAISFAACNQCLLVTKVYEAAIGPHKDDADAKRLILRRIKEAFLKAMPVISVPRALNSMFPLFKAIPDEESVDKEVVRKDIDKADDLYERGVRSFEGLFGKPDTDILVARCTQYWPDLLTLIMSQNYGTYVGELAVLGKVETSQCLIAGLLPMDAPVELAWHWRGLMMVGGSLEQVKSTTELVKSICDISGVQLRNELFDVDEAVRDHGLVAKHVH